MKFTDSFFSAAGKSTIREFVESLVIAGVLAFFIITFVVQSFVVYGQSMEPTLYNGERLFVNKFIYRFKEPARGDIIVFRPKGPKNERYVKRVIGIPGDTIVIEDHKVYVNDEVLDEDYIDVAIGRDFGKYVVPEGHVFVLGDNRHPYASSDSRYQRVGYVDYDSISGKAFVIYWPLNKIEVLKKPKYDFE